MFQVGDDVLYKNCLAFVFLITNAGAYVIRTSCNKEIYAFECELSRCTELVKALL